MTSCKHEPQYLYFRDKTNDVCSKYEMLEDGDFKLIEEVPGQSHCDLDISMTIETYQFFRREYKKMIRKQDKTVRQLQLEANE